MSRQSRFQRTPKLKEMLEDELMKKVIQRAISNIEKNPQDNKYLEYFIQLHLQKNSIATQQEIFNDSIETRQKIFNDIMSENSNY